MDGSVFSGPSHQPCKAGDQWLRGKLELLGAGKGDLVVIIWLDYLGAFDEASSSRSLIH